jgi:molybdate transport system substrate-binding protein
MFSKRRTLVVALVILFSAGTGSARETEGQLTVYAAASLTDVFPKIDSSPRYSFAGSNLLAAQIQQGAPADVFASANMALPKQLFAKALCSKPVVFTRNSLVVVVPKSNPAGIRTVSDLMKPGVKIVIADSGVPVGVYTIQVLRKMNISAPVLKNVVSEETDVREVLSKVALGEADAGFVYSTDAKAVPGRVTAIRLPARARANVRYGICVVTTSDAKADAHAFVNKVLSKAGQAKLVAAGFLPRIARKR